MNDSFVCVSDASGEVGAYGEPCEFINVCDPGLFCATPTVVPGCEGSTGCCSAFCDLGLPDATSSCPGAADGQECVAWFEPGRGSPELLDIGACAIPRP